MVRREFVAQARGVRSLLWKGRLWYAGWEGRGVRSVSIIRGYRGRC